MSGNSAKSFITLKKEAYADAEAEFAAQGKPLPDGHVPPIDLWQIRHFRDAEETAAMEANPTPVYAQVKKRRQARAAVELAAAEGYRRELQEKQDKRETAWLDEMEKRKADREREAQEREERQRMQRENAALVRADNKRKRETGDADSQAAQSNQGTTGNKAYPSFIVTGGARVSHGNSRWRPMVVDSDDEAEFFPKAKRVRTSKEDTPVVVHADRLSSLKRKRAAQDSHESDIEPLALKSKRRRFETVRLESNKENLGQKKVHNEAVKGGNSVKATAKRPVALGAKMKMSATAGISKTKLRKSQPSN
ncbi:hypothetical protein A1O1_00961 [Capronia coronata CBS 617.96]|uniref:Uncharacterized protein n=1 Tax=Capronia coronata CBS 617.96 TaxID=1182541 RepID=W9Z2R0_9EURO|nr:uncharacterized protein A1O1_00961 [Capronia coronata CBS 617.96]EXJ95836.1 hypothetical protein A1O1_00961 [Capronia coronata CBS 617.96]